MHQPSRRHLAIHSWSSSTMLLQCQLTCHTRRVNVLHTLIMGLLDLLQQCVPEHIGRGCEGPGRRTSRGRGLWAAGRWSLQPAGGAVCSRWCSGTWAAPPNSGAQSPPAQPSSGCRTSYETNKGHNSVHQKHQFYSIRISYPLKLTHFARSCLLSSNSWE